MHSGEKRCYIFSYFQEFFHVEDDRLLRWSPSWHYKDLVSILAKVTFVEENINLVDKTFWDVNW